MPWTPNLRGARRGGIGPDGRRRGTVADPARTAAGHLSAGLLRPVPGEPRPAPRGIRPTAPAQRYARNCRRRHWRRRRDAGGRNRIRHSPRRHGGHRGHGEKTYEINLLSLLRASVVNCLLTPPHKEPAMSHLSRRSFLKAAGVGALATLSPTSVGRVRGANDPIRIGVAGLNGRGRSPHWRVAQDKGRRDHLPDRPRHPRPGERIKHIGDNGGSTPRRSRTSARPSTTRTSMRSRSPRPTTGTP